MSLLRALVTYFLILAQVALLSYVLLETTGVSITKSPFRASSYDWAHVDKHNPLAPVATKIPPGRQHNFGYVQHHFDVHSRFEIATQKKRRNKVKEVFLRSWNNYKERAWLSDELMPVTGGRQDTYGGWAATLVDALDTLWIMGLKDDFENATQAIAALDFANTTALDVSVFETTIRYVGGFLSAYDLSGQPALLQKAVEIGDMVYAAFDTPNHMPAGQLRFAQAKAGTLLADISGSLAAPASLSMEFTRLTQLSGDPKYYEAIARVTDRLQEAQTQTKLPGMWPKTFDLRDDIMNNSRVFSIGAGADSGYEYLLKMQLLLAGGSDQFRDMYLYAADTIEKEILFRPLTPENEDILVSGTVSVTKAGPLLIPKVEHLSCFAGGMYAIGGRILNNPYHVDIGAKITKGCIWAYSAFPHGIMPEDSHVIACARDEDCVWRDERWQTAVTQHYNQPDHFPRGFVKSDMKYYILRPEAIESIFILYRITGDEYYREAAWKMFEAIEKATATPYGNAGLVNVVHGPLRQKDEMQSFWLAETLKYFYLIFSPPDIISLDDFVFNTEAHPFRRPKP